MKIERKKPTIKALLIAACLLIVSLPTMNYLLSQKRTDITYGVDCIWSDSQMFIRFRASPMVTSGSLLQWVNATWNIYKHSVYADTSALDRTSESMSFLLTVSETGTTCETTTAIPSYTSFYPTVNGIYGIHQDYLSKGVMKRGALKIEQGQVVESDMTFEQVCAMGPPLYSDTLKERGWMQGEIVLPRRTGQQFTLEAANCLNGIQIELECLEEHLKDGIDNGFQLTLNIKESKSIQIRIENSGEWKITENGQTVKQGYLPLME